MSKHRLFQDDLPTSASISGLRGGGVVIGDTKTIDISFVENDDTLHRTVRVVHRKLRNGGSWSFFLCPICERRARVLKLYDGAAMCRWCCLARGVGYRVASGSPREREAARAARIERLRKQLYGGEPARLKPRPGRVLDRRRALEVSLKRAVIVKRLDMLQRWRAGKLLH
jgi:hypothetical protein